VWRAARDQVATRARRSVALKRTIEPDQPARTSADDAGRVAYALLAIGALGAGGVVLRRRLAPIGRGLARIGPAGMDRGDVFLIGAATALTITAAALWLPAF
jgi:hypothetical protein